MEYNYDVYKAKVVRWKDGDTVILDIRQGFKVRTEQTVRLRDIDAPEKSVGAASAACVARCNELAPIGSTVHLETKSVDRYGRWLGDVSCNGVSIGNQLLTEGLVKLYPKK